MARYLSAEWFDAAQRVLSGRVAAAGEAAGEPLTVQHHVTGTPDGDVTFHVVRDAGGVVRLARGGAPSPTVTFTEDYATASEIGRGDLSAQGAFMAGRIRVGGDVARLVEQADAFAGIEDALAPLRAETSY